MKNLKQKNGFLITCVSCIAMILVFCYFGLTANSLKGTHSIPVANVPSGEQQPSIAPRPSRPPSSPAGGGDKDDDKPTTPTEGSSCKVGGYTGTYKNGVCVITNTNPNIDGFDCKMDESGDWYNCTQKPSDSTGTTCSGYTTWSSANSAGIAACGAGKQTVRNISSGCYMYSCNGTGGTGSYQCWFDSGKYVWGTSGSYPVSDSYCSGGGSSSSSSSSGGTTGSCPGGYYSYSIASNLASAMCGDREIKFSTSSTNSSCYTYSCVGDDKVYSCDGGETTQTTSTCSEHVEFSSQLPLTLSKACEAYMGEGYTGTCTQTDNGDDNNAGTARYSYSCNCTKTADVIEDGCDEGYTYSDGKCVVDKCPNGMTIIAGECASSTKTSALTCEEAYGSAGTNQKWVGSCTAEYRWTHGDTIHSCSCSKTCNDGYVSVNGSCVSGDIEDASSSAPSEEKCYYEDRDECEYISDRGCEKDSNGCYSPGGTGTYQCWFYNGSYVMSNYGSYPVDDTYCKTQKEVKCNEGELSVHPNGDSSSNWVCKTRSVDGGGVCYYGCTNYQDGAVCTELTTCDASKGQYAALDENGNCVCACDCADGTCDNETNTAKQCWICGSSYVWNYASEVNRSNCRLTIKTEGNCNGKAPVYPGNPGDDDDDDGIPNYKDPDKSSGENVIQNPQTGEILMFVIWVVAFASIAYSIYYFKKVKES